MSHHTGGESSNSASSADSGRAAEASSCCAVAKNAALTGRLGRVVVAFPDGAIPQATRVGLRRNGEEVQSGFGSQSWDLLPGTYEIAISGKTVPDVPVQSGADTTVLVGVLRISASAQTKSEVLDEGQVIASGYGDTLVGLPAGDYELRIAGQAETVTIEPGQITDF